MFEIINKHTKAIIRHRTVTSRNTFISYFYNQISWTTTTGGAISAKLYCRPIIVEGKWDTQIKLFITPRTKLGGFEGVGLSTNMKGKHVKGIPQQLLSNQMSVPNLK